MINKVVSKWSEATMAQNCAKVSKAQTYVIISIYKDIVYSLKHRVKNISNNLQPFWKIKKNVLSFSEWENNFNIANKTVDLKHHTRNCVKHFAHDSMSISIFNTCKL